MDYNEWRKAYRERKIIHLREEFTDTEIQIIEKLGYPIEDKIYTQYEYDVLKGEIARYYKEDDMDQEELEYLKSLEITGVTEEEYNKILKKFEELDLKHYDKFPKMNFNERTDDIMNCFPDSSTIDTLFNARNEEFSKNVIKKSSEYQSLLESIEYKTKGILNFVESEHYEFCKNEIDDILFEMLEMTNFWNKNFYELGILERIKLKKEVKIEE